MTSQALWIFLTLAVMALLYLLAPILTPFLLGALLAYLIDPLVQRLEKWHCPHLLSVVLIFAFFFIGIIYLLSISYPLIIKQIDTLAASLPNLIDWVHQIGLPWLTQYIDLDTLRNSLPSTLSKSAWLAGTFLKSSLAALHTLVFIVLTPIVTFYLLRDWKTVLQGIKSLLPKEKAPVIIQLAKDCDEVLGAFIRGQLLVMLCLGLIYAIGLSLAGLKLGLIIGLLGGLFSIIPYLGAFFVVVAATIAALVQFGTYQAVTEVMIVFLIGQLAESYLLTPYFVGGRIGLHPVAIIFSIMAGGTLFGFFGVLLALPVAAVLMASFRFFRRQQVVAIPS